MGRTAALLAALFMIGLLAFLTIRVAITEGIDILVVTSVVILLVLGFGVIGALTAPDD